MEWRSSRFVEVLRTSASFSASIAVVGTSLVFFFGSGKSLTNWDYLFVGVAGGVFIVSWLWYVYRSSIEFEAQKSTIELEKKKLEDVVRQIGDVRGRDEFSTIESKKALATDSLFEANRRRTFKLTSLQCRDARFFSDFAWPLSREFNLLLGKNGYGKSYILHALAGLVVDNYTAVAKLFPKEERNSIISLELEYQRADATDAVSEIEKAEIEFSREGLRTNLGPIPLLAIPDLRFIDKATVKIRPGLAQDIVRDGSTLFLAEQPIEGLVQTMLYRLCVDYIDYKRLDLPSLKMLERVITKLSESDFQFHSIERSVEADFEIKVIAEGLTDYPIPLQRASQGTLSVVAMFGLIERFLRALYPAPITTDVCDRSGIVIIDELDAHLHPSWQRRIVGLLRETFPNVQFIVSAHSPLVVAGRHENEVAVLRKQGKRQFVIETQTKNFMGADLDAIIEKIFESDTVDETVDTYLARRPERARLEARISQLKSLKNRTRAQEIELGHATIELERIIKATSNFADRMQSDDLKENVQALKARNASLEEEIALLRKAGETQANKGGAESATTRSNPGA